MSVPKPSQPPGSSAGARATAPTRTGGDARRAPSVGAAGFERMGAAFIADIRQDLADDKLIWPSVPVVVMKVRKVLADPDASVETITRAVSTDPALSAKLLKVANSVHYANARPCKTLRNAVVRLGNQAIEHAVLLLVVSQVFNVGQRRRIQPLLARLWRHSTLVAAICEQLSVQSPRLQADVAMLAGLIHDIGTVPVLVRAERVPRLLDNPQLHAPLIDLLHAEVGEAMLAAWRFPAELVQVAGEHEDNGREHDAPRPDYLDTVIAANVLSRIGTRHRHAEVCLDSVPAIRRFGLSTQDLVEILTEAKRRETVLKSL